jgi:hypothetical protein
LIGAGRAIFAVGRSSCLAISDARCCGGFAFFPSITSGLTGCRSFRRAPRRSKYQCIGSGCLRPKLQAGLPYKTRPSVNSSLLPLLLGFVSPHTIRPPPGR